MATLNVSSKRLAYASSKLVQSAAADSTSMVTVQNNRFIVWSPDVIASGHIDRNYVGTSGTWHAADSDVIALTCAKHPVNRTYPHEIIRNGNRVVKTAKTWNKTVDTVLIDADGVAHPLRNSVSKEDRRRWHAVDREIHAKQNAAHVALFDAAFSSKIVILDYVQVDDTTWAVHAECTDTDGALVIRRVAGYTNNPPAKWSGR